MAKWTESLTRWAGVSRSIPLGIGLSATPLEGCEPPVFAPSRRLFLGWTAALIAAPNLRRLPCSIGSSLTYVGPSPVVDLLALPPTKWAAGSWAQQSGLVLAIQALPAVAALTPPAGVIRELGGVAFSAGPERWRDR